MNRVSSFKVLSFYNKALQIDQNWSSKSESIKSIFKSIKIDKSQDIEGCVSIIIHGNRRTLEKSGEIKRNQSLKAQSKEVLTNWKSSVSGHYHCSLFTFLPSPCNCLLLQTFVYIFSIIGVFTGYQRWSMARVSAGTLIPSLQRFGKRSAV